MYFSRSPPKYTKFKVGGSNYKNKSNSSLNTSSSSSSLLTNTKETTYFDTQHQHSQYHYQQQQHHHDQSSLNSSNRTSSTMSVSSAYGNKRGKRHWGPRERSGMSFLIVIAFFAVFGIIILTEVFMIDERSHNAAMSMRHSNGYMGRMGDSMPDYDNVKDDYDLLDENLANDNKLGFLQFRDNKLKIHDSVSNEGSRLAGVLLSSNPNGQNGNAGQLAGGGIGIGAGNMPLIPWGKVLPANVEETLPRYPYGTIPTDGSWQIVNGTRFKFFVFSAYYDKRDGAKLIRVVGATKTRGPERVWCRFWYTQRNSTLKANTRQQFKSTTVMARVKIIRENWNLKYSACFVLCPVRSPELEVPQYVSIVARLRTPPGNVLELRNTEWDKDFLNVNPHPFRKNIPSSTDSEQSSLDDKIAVCVKPFHFEYDQGLYLMEYLEFYALLGVSHFTFYNHTIGPHAECVLEHYMRGEIPTHNSAKTDLDRKEVKKAQTQNATVASVTAQHLTNISHISTIAQTHTDTQAQEQRTPTQGTNAQYVKPTVTMLPWNLRMRSQKEIRTEGLFAALNDCLYRTMYRYKYLALVDLDEFIVPRRTDTLNELINSLNRRFHNRNTGAYSFQNAFFYLQFPDDTMATEEMENESLTRVRAALVTQRKTKRRFKLHPQKQRSKYICKPEAVVEAGNHFVWEFSPGKGSMNVPSQDAILQHYRVCEFGGNDCIKAPSVVDRTAIKYVNTLVQRVEAVYKHLRGPCRLPDLPALPTQVKPKETLQKASTKPSNELKNKNRVSKNQIEDIELSKNEMNNENNNDNKISQLKENKATLMATSISGGKNIDRTYNLELRKHMNTSTSLQSNPKLNENKNNITEVKKQENFKRKRKVIVFERDDLGEPFGRIEYV